MGRLIGKEVQGMNNLMPRDVWGVGMVLFAAASSSGKEPGEKGLDQDRIRQVSALLSEKPAGFGRPISDRAAWDVLARHGAYPGVIKEAEKIIRQPIPELPDELYLDFSRTGNRTHWQAVSGQRHARFRELVLAECLENKGRFLAAIEAIARELCKERTWVMPAHDRQLSNFKGTAVDIDLGSSMLGWELATACYLLGDKVSPEVRQVIRDNLHRRIFDPFRGMVQGKRRPNAWLTVTNNWNAVCLAGVTGAALTLLESREDRAFFVVAAEQYSRHFLEGFTPDGYCSEGVGYWEYGFGYYLMLSEAIWQATGGRIDLLAGKKVATIARYGRGIEILNGVYPAFADCSVNEHLSPTMMAFIDRRFGLAPASDEKITGPGGALYSVMMYSFPNSASQMPPPQTAPSKRDIRTWFDQGGVLICRPAEGSSSRFAVALKGGHNAEHHNHNDVGSYVVVVGSRPVLLDPGAEVYTARTFSNRRYESKVLNSFGHPVPAVAGQLQRTGRQAQAKVLRTDFTPEADTLVLDIASAYTVKELKSLHRTFVYSRQGAGSLTVTDEVAFTSPKEFETALITFGQWKKLDAKALQVSDHDGAVRVEISVTGGEYEIRSEEIREELHTKTLPTRIAIRLTQPVREALVRVRISPLP
jgi:hypothetical protein